MYTSQVAAALAVKASPRISNINVNRNGRFNLVSMRVPFSYPTRVAAAHGRMNDAGGEK